jgi:hypothetical protein
MSMVRVKAYDDEKTLKMLDAYSEIAQTIANCGSQLVHNLGELETALKSLESLGDWPQIADATSSADHRQSRLAIIKSRLRNSRADFDRAAEMLKQGRDALAKFAR